ncbi:stalk domain-containing protein [Paenibacillus faecalis]|uniref:stalk domain-containing protein n=1 Tax=Paenibacillus faecalis TaxID=2079532 RepID=UPI000D114B62|nr:stalk domain-containing protein [Paenibacillus faecalis]
MKDSCNPVIRRLVFVLLTVLVLALPWWSIGGFVSADTAGAAGVHDENRTNHLKLTSSKAAYVFNGKTGLAAQPIIKRDGYHYVPLRTMAKLYGLGLSYSAKTKETTVQGEEGRWSYKTGSAKAFSNGTPVVLNAKVISYRGSTMVSIRDWANLTGSKLVTKGGNFTLSWERDAAEVSPPVADFTTDKPEYRLGEPVVYNNLSYDPQYEMVKETWTGNEPAFFTPGEHEVMLEVENSKGAVATVRKTVTILDEWLYTREQYDQLYTPVGKKFEIDGNSVLMMDSIPYTVIPEENKQFIRSNSPEHLMDEGIAYEDIISGSVRVNIHNQNRANKSLSVYLMATNPGDSDIVITTGPIGMGGPARYVSSSGKAAVTRYLEAVSSGTEVANIQLAPGETVVLLPEKSKTPLKPGQVRTLYTDLHVKGEVRLSVVAADPSRDPVQALKELPMLPRDGKHVRGTFEGANRTIEVEDVIGEEPQRLVLGDPELDGYLEGVDAVTGALETNVGNTGVLYSMKLRIAPNTLVALNARGGHYAGALLVNGKIVQMTDGSILKNQAEAGVLYRTGDQAESVTFKFMPASGSNLPVHMLFIPLPKS